MKHNSKIALQCTFIFTIGIVASFIGYFLSGSQFMGGFLIAIALFFLLGGWYFFRGYYPEGHPLLLVLFGYLYATIFMAFTFTISGWPMAVTFLTMAPVWLFTLFLVVFIIRKKLSKAGYIRFLVEIVLMAILCILFYLKK